MSKTIRTSNDLTLDATGDIILDADGADLKLQDGGTEFGRISRITSDLVIKSMGTNNDILLKGLDGSDTITALQLDMSDNGKAIFSGNVTATDITANSLTTNVISSNGSNADISIQPSGTGDVLLSAVRVNGTTLDSSDSTAININEALVVDGTGNFSGTLTTAALTTVGTHTVTGQADIEGVTIKDNTISSNASNSDLEITANGTGKVEVEGVSFFGTTLTAADSSTININEGLVVDGTANVTGTLTANGLINGVQTLTGSGSTEVISLTETVTQLITTGTQNFSLANGTEGQIKIITLKTDGGNATVTPASFLNGTSITFDAVEDTMTLLYQSTGWVVLAQQNTTVNA